MNKPLSPADAASTNPQNDKRRLAFPCSYPAIPSARSGSRTIRKTPAIFPDGSTFLPDMSDTANPQHDIHTKNEKYPDGLLGKRLSGNITDNRFFLDYSMSVIVARALPDVLDLP